MSDVYPIWVHLQLGVSKLHRKLPTSKIKLSTELNRRKTQPELLASKFRFSIQVTFLSTSSSSSSFNYCIALSFQRIPKIFIFIFNSTFLFFQSVVMEIAFKIWRSEYVTASILFLNLTVTFYNALFRIFIFNTNETSWILYRTLLLTYLCILKFQNLEFEWILGEIETENLRRIMNRKFGGGKQPTGTPSLPLSCVVVIFSLLAGASVVHNIYKPNLVSFFLLITLSSFIFMT